MTPTHAVSQRPRSSFRRLLRDENGFILSAELILLMTFLMMAAIVGFAVIKDAVATELNDVSNAIGSFDQSFQVSGLTAPSQDGGVDHGSCAGFGFSDQSDTCDCATIQIAGGGGGEGGNTVGGFGGASASGGGGGGGGGVAGAAGGFAVQAAAAPAAVQATDNLVPVLVDEVEGVQAVNEAARVQQTDAPKDCCPCPPGANANTNANAAGSGSAPSGQSSRSQSTPTQSSPTQYGTTPTRR